jgi:hypothetical protein
LPVNEGEQRATVAQALEVVDEGRDHAVSWRSLAVARASASSTEAGEVLAKDRSWRRPPDAAATNRPVLPGDDELNDGRAAAEVREASPTS